MSGDFSIREAHLSDAGALARFATQLGYPTTADQAAGRAAEILDHPGNRILVAEEGGVVVGWIHVAQSVTLESDPAAEIAGLVVDEAFRGAGVGTQLVVEAEAWAAGQGSGRIRVRSNGSGTAPAASTSAPGSWSRSDSGTSKCLEGCTGSD